MWRWFYDLWQWDRVLAIIAIAAVVVFIAMLIAYGGMVWYLLRVG